MNTEHRGFSCKIPTLLIRTTVDDFAAVPAVVNLALECIIPWARYRLFKKAGDIANIGGTRNRCSEGGDDESDNVELHLPMIRVS